jgi:catechol 2,3-dioxygenase-like lactoylglutathione lyase family enzyme
MQIEEAMSQLKVSDLRPFIHAKDFALCKRFYSSLGWETKDVGDGLALVRLADEQHFYLQDYYLKEVAENCMLHLTVEDAQAWYEQVSSVLRKEAQAGARVQPPKLQPYGALVTFVHDPSGVLLHLCQWLVPSRAPVHVARTKA